MSRFIYEKNGFTIDINTKYLSNRDGFSHTATAWLSGREIECYGYGKCHYINRTWEAFTYQSVILVALNDLVTDIDLRGHWMRDLGYKKMTSKRILQWEIYIESIVSKYNTHQKLSVREEAFCVIQNCIATTRRGTLQTPEFCKQV